MFLGKKNSRILRNLEKEKRRKNWGEVKVIKEGSCEVGRDRLRQKQ